MEYVHEDCVDNLFNRLIIMTSESKQYKDIKSNRAESLIAWSLYFYE